MDPLVASVPFTFPSFCNKCHGRYRCVCAILETLGYCWECQRYGCGQHEAVSKPACNRCNATHECVCSILIYYGHCSTCMKLDCKEHGSKTEKCILCDSPYACVCDLLVECGNCPHCLKLQEKCVCEEKAVRE
jgi:hypothetical protein